MKRPTLSPYLPALLLLAFSTGWVAMLTLAPQPGQAVAAIFPPHFGGDPSLRAAVAAGDDEILAFGGLNFIILLRSADPAIIRHLYQNGALLVIRAPLLTDCLR